MVAILALAFFVVPIVELMVIIQIGSAVGALNTIGLLILSGILGGWLMKREGLGVARRFQQAMAEGRVPGAELIDAFLILFGGALMLTPGFVTDGVGMLLLLPPVRIVVRGVVRRRFTVKVLGARSGQGGPAGPTDPDVIDL